MPILWVVEMQDPGSRVWQPTVGCELTHKRALEAIRTEWRPNHPMARFRAVRYAKSDTKTIDIQVAQSLAEKLNDLLDALNRSNVRQSIATCSAVRRAAEALSENEDILPRTK